MKSKGKNPPRFTANQIINALRDSKGLVYRAARRLKCDPKTMYNYINKFPTIKQALIDIREETVDNTESRLFEAIENGEAWAIQLHLTTIGKDRGYGREPTRVENNLTISLESPREKIVKRLETIAQRRIGPPDDGDTDRTILAG